VLETVPGLIVTQHSGSGKANQFFFRGFNLDHGTDFATWVGGMPVNNSSHGHGQGYTDLNFLIPELVQSIDYKKGPYYASEGDFSATGAAHINYVQKMESNLAVLTGGSFGYARSLLAGSTPIASGNFLGALELQRTDGPWDHSENVRKINGVASYSRGDADEGWSVTAMGYSNAWNSTDQIPKRAVKSGLIDRFGAIDTSDGGRSMRYSLSGEWHRETETSITKVNAYAIEYQMNLFSNFTYFLDNPDDGDQFEQEDKRIIAGATASHAWIGKWNGQRVENTIGIQNRNDVILDVGLFNTNHRKRLSTTRDDDVLQNSVSPYFENNIQWIDKFRTVTGFRTDVFFFDVESNTPENSGGRVAAIASPKLSLIFGPWAKTEYYLNFGMGFHSNDARGVTSNIDPKSGDPISSARPLVRVKGTEFGIRTTYIPHLNSTLGLFAFDFDSELVFVGDAGNTEASRPSRRAGIEFANYYTPLDWLTFDFDLSLDHARFRGSDSAGNHIPGAIKTVLATGVAIDHRSGFLAGARLRYFGERPLIEDNSQRSDPTAMLSARLGYKFNSRVSLIAEGFNLLSRKDSDIDYFYASRLKGEAADGVDDKHFHPVEPISGRLTLVIKW